MLENNFPLQDRTVVFIHVRLGTGAAKTNNAIQPKLLGKHFNKRTL